MNVLQNNNPLTFFGGYQIIKMQKDFDEFQTSFFLFQLYANVCTDN